MAYVHKIFKGGNTYKEGVRISQMAFKENVLEKCKALEPTKSSL